MRQFDYSAFPEKLLTPEICNLLAAIHEYRGKQDFFLTAKRDVLQPLRKIAVIQSTDFSNRIEGIFTSDDRLKALVKQHAEPSSWSEREIAGYRDVLAAIHENDEYFPVTPDTILRLHRDLFSYQSDGNSGSWRTRDNFIDGTDAFWEERGKFSPLPAAETPEAMEQLCRAYSDAVGKAVFDPLLLSLLFIFDFLCIYPFNNGSGRVGRLLLLLFLHRHGYIAGKYVSLEMLMEKSKQTYYESLQESSRRWNNGKNSYFPFLRYMLGIILKAYREFEDRVVLVITQNANKAKRVRFVFDSRPGMISKADIAEQYPDISMITIEENLCKLVKLGVIEKLGAGKNTMYIKRQEKTEK